MITVTSAMTLHPNTERYIFQTKPFLRPTDGLLQIGGLHVSILKAKRFLSFLKYDMKEKERNMYIYIYTIHTE